MYKLIKLEKELNHYSYLEEFIKIALFSFDSKKIDQKIKAKKYREIFENGRDFYVILNNEKVISGLINYEYFMRLRNSIVKMSGIGTVCAKIDFRGKGCVAFLMKEILNILFEEGYVFSTLFPFDIEFYRKYGYEYFVDNITYTINGGIIKPIKNNKNINYEEIVFPDQETIDYYKKHCKDNYNYVIREKKEWLEYLNTSNNNNISESIIKFKKNNKITGMIICNYIYVDNKNTMFITGMFFDDYETKNSIFNFLRIFKNQIHEIVLCLPKDIIIWPYLSEPPKDIKKGYTVLGRVINIEKLNGLELNSQDMNLCIQIVDEIISNNNGIYEMEIKNNILKISKTDKRPSLKTDIKTFSAIVSGYTNFSEMIDHNKIETIGKYDGQDIKKSITHFVEFF